MRRPQRGLLAALVLVGVTGALQGQVAEKKGLTADGARRVTAGRWPRPRSGRRGRRRACRYRN
jgi:hypothetical protein